MGDCLFLQKNGYDEALAHDFGIVIAGAPVPVKFGFWNDKDRIVNPVISFSESNSNDMSGLMLVGLDTVTLSCPYNVSAALSSGASSLVTGTKYYYVITAFCCNGETGVSVEVSATPTLDNPSITLAWNALAGADGYRIYRSTTSGFYMQSQIANIADPSAITLIDTGISSNMSNAPMENTTAGASPNYGTAIVASWGVNLGLGQLQAGQQKFFWVKVNATELTTETGNPRLCLMDAKE